MSKYLSNGEKGKRGSKNNLTKGAFGLVGRKKLPYKLWKKLGIQLSPQTKKEIIPFVYTPYKVNKNKYTPTSKSVVKK